MDSSSEFPPSLKALAESLSASPIPWLVMANLFESVAFGCQPTDHIAMAGSHFWLPLAFHY
jgi:hypothetical protein